MKCQIEDVAPLVKSLKVTVSKETIRQEIALAYAHLKREVSVPGFRPGQAPLSLLEKKYGQKIHSDVIEKTLRKALHQAMEESALVYVTVPIIENAGYTEDAAFSFTSRIEIAPEIHLQYSGLALPRVDFEIKPEHVDDALCRIQEDCGVWGVCPEDHVASHGDYVVVDTKLFVAGQALPDREGIVTLKVGSKTNHETIESAVLGKKKGDIAECSVSYALDHEDHPLAGKTVLYHMTLQEIKERPETPLDDDLAIDAGFSSLLEMRNHVTHALEERIKIESKNREKDRLLAKLLETHTFDLPPSLVASEIRVLVENHEPEPLSDADSERAAAWGALCQKYGQQAETNVKIYLLLNAIAAREQIQITEQEIDQEIERCATRLRCTQQEARHLLSREGRGQTWVAQMRYEKTLDRVHALTRFEDTLDTQRPVASLQEAVSC